MTTFAIPRFRRDALEDDTIGAALERVGYCVLDGAVDPAIVAAVRATAPSVFHLPARVRERYRAPLGGSGYVAPHAERVLSYGVTSDRACWDIRRADTTTHGLPREVPGFSDAATALFTTLEHLADTVFACLDAHLPTAAGTIAAGAHGGDHLLRVNRYPLVPPPPPDTLARFAPHRDFGLVTLLCGGDEPGLEVEVDGAWHAIAIPSDAVLVLGGTTLRLWTDGRTVAPRHRVVWMPVERYSIVFFIELRPDVVLPNGETAGAFLARQLERIRPTA